MPIFHWDVDQGSAQWHQLRSGIPTASMFDRIITPKTLKMSAQRIPYACRLIAERLLNWQAESLDYVAAIAAGKEGEPDAVKRFEFVTETITRPLGFATTNDGRFGASPDRVLGHSIDAPPPASVDAICEVKAPTIPTQMQRLLFGHDDAYRCQVMGQLLVTEAERSVFYSWHPRMPAYQVDTTRDEPFIHRLSEALEQFSDELEELMERALSLGAYQAFAELLTPLDAARGPEAEKDLAEIIEGGLDNKLQWGG